MEKGGCTLCPRECGADRSREKGACGTDSRLMVARAALHYWEEPCISGEEGSGTVFFSGCSLGCVYCQNREISDGRSGICIDAQRLGEIFLELQEQGANNINLVTAGHYLSALVPVLAKARENGLAIPFVYNTGGYEKKEAIRALSGLVDVYLPDFKYWSPQTAERYSRAPDYPEVAKEALDEMVSQTGEPVFDSRGIMQRGVIVRHLVLPGHTGESKKIIRYVHERYEGRVYLSIMNQYTPMPGIEKDYPELARRVRRREYDAVVDYAISIGVENGFIQEGDTAQGSFIPPFDHSGVLASCLSRKNDPGTVSHAGNSITVKG